MDNCYNVYVKCTNCGHQPLLPIEIPKGRTIRSYLNITTCKKCGCNKVLTEVRAKY